MQNLSTLLIFPIVVGVIVLLIEYFITQPIRKANDTAIPSSPAISRDWVTAMKKAVKQFKAQQTGYTWKWWLPNSNRATIEEWKIAKGQATLTLAVSAKQEVIEKPVPELLYFSTVRRVIAKYQLVIDRTGDILKLDSVPVEIASPSVSTAYRQEDLPETTLVIKNQKPPVLKKVENGAMVVIEFEVENRGRAGKVCPYIEFQAVTMRGDGKYTPKPFRLDPVSHDISALSTLPIRFEQFFPSPDVPLVKPPHKVKVELYPYPGT